MKEFIIINPADNVAVALKDFNEGDHITFGSKSIELKQQVGRGHKIALCGIKKGTDIIKYGDAIGHAVCDIYQGEWVHTHSMKTNLSGILTYSYSKEVCKNTVKTACINVYT
jgi:altronate hydrolase